MKKLLRSKTDVKLCGVCAGMATYVGLDPTLVRLLWIVGTLCTGFFIGILIYFVCVFIIPIEDDIIE